MNFQYQKTAKESYVELMVPTSKRYLIDVRSNGEWRSGGISDLSPLQDRTILCEWRKYPSMKINENFFDELTEQLDLSKIDSLYFICAAGVRSQEAMMCTSIKLKELGIPKDCVNIYDGFEGNSDKIFSFGQVSGWKATGLPWCELETHSIHTGEEY